MVGLLIAKFALLASHCYPHEDQTPGPAGEQGHLSLHVLHRAGQPNVVRLRRVN
jgi:hypothetical protein